MSVPQQGNPVDRLMDHGERGKGQKHNEFMAEFKVRLVTNAVITFMKGFPGFTDWWFETLEGDRRQYIHQELQVTLLNEFTRASGLLEQKAEVLRDCVIRFFDKLPTFSQWHQVTLGADLRGRIRHQLKDYIYKEIR